MTHPVSRALAAVGAGHGVAAMIDPPASPIIAVGSVLIDAAPTPAKEFAVRTFGSYDKLILISSIGVLLLIFAAVLGLIGWRRRPISLIGISLLGVAGIAAAVTRGSAIDGIPSLVAGAVGVAALSIMTSRPVGDSTDGTDGLLDDGSHFVEIPDPIRMADPTRRRFLLGLGGAGLVAALAGGGGIVLERVRQAGSAARRLVGLPAPSSMAAVIPAGAQLDKVTPFITPNDRFYRVDISLVTPRVDPDGWILTIDGMVDKPMQLTYDDLLKLPMIERNITLTCVSNEVGGPYVSTATWLGVPFAEIIKKVGVQHGVEQVYSYSSDSGYTCSTPYQAVSDGRDAMIVIAMNGAPLPDAHGFPARMLVPGLFGFVSATKWLRRIEFSTYAKRSAYWTDRNWATDAPILTQSRIDVPKSLSSIPKDDAVIAGVAWAQHRGIDKVEIKIDDDDWRETRLAASAGIDLWRQWSFVYDGPAGLHRAQVRATDLNGDTQLERRTKVFPSGATGWHQIQFTTE